MLKSSVGVFCRVTVLAVLAAGVPLVAKRAPDPGFKTLDGQTRKLSALRGQIVVVNFWATWCGPCQEELPRLSQMAAAYSGKPVAFVLISIDEPKNRGKIPEKLTSLRVSLQSWVDADTDTLDRFGLGNIVPGTVVLDDKGEVVDPHHGRSQRKTMFTAPSTGSWPAKSARLRPHS